MLVKQCATGCGLDACGVDRRCPCSEQSCALTNPALLLFACLLVGEDIRERTDALDAAGNTTAAIGKGFAIGSAALVSLALFGAYVTRSKIDLIESSILDPKVG